MLLATLFIVGGSFLPVSDNASAGITKNVRGHIYDQLGNPIGGANVTVKAIRGGITMDTLWYDSSEIDGLYTVTFGFTDSLELGDTIEVTASYSGHQSINSTIADSSPQQVVDVSISGVFVPEFGGLPIFVVCGAFVAIFILARRRRSGL